MRWGKVGFNGQGKERVKVLTCGNDRILCITTLTLPETFTGKKSRRREINHGLKTDSRPTRVYFTQKKKRKASGENRKLKKSRRESWRTSFCTPETKGGEVSKQGEKNGQIRERRV